MVGDSIVFIFTKTNRISNKIQELNDDGSKRDTNGLLEKLQVLCLGSVWKFF